LDTDAGVGKWVELDFTEPGHPSGVLAKDEGLRELPSHEDEGLRAGTRVGVDQQDEPSLEGIRGTLPVRVVGVEFGPPLGEVLALG